MACVVLSMLSIMPFRMQLDAFSSANATTCMVPSGIRCPAIARMDVVANSSATMVYFSAAIVYIVSLFFLFLGANDLVGVVQVDDAVFVPANFV